MKLVTHPIFTLKLPVFLMLLSTIVFSQDLATLQRQFQTPPDDSRIMMRWWWFGPTVTKAELEREMRVMKEGGIGGFEIQPVYPVVLDDASKGLKTVPFLSDENTGTAGITVRIGLKLFWLWRQTPRVSRYMFRFCEETATIRRLSKGSCTRCDDALGSRRRPSSSMAA